MDKDKQARLEAKGWRFGDADEFLGADAGQLEVDETYKTDNVEALVAENARLKAEVAAANKGAKTNALVNESLANKLKIAVEALEHYADKGNWDSNKGFANDVWYLTERGWSIARNALAKIKEPSKGRDV